MTAVAAAPYRSGFCASGRHDRCRGDYGSAVCDCPHHTEPFEPASDRLERAAVHLGVDTVPHSLPAPAIAHLAALLRSEAAWAAARHDTYPGDRAPLLKLADLILEGT